MADAPPGTQSGPMDNAAPPATERPDGSQGPRVTRDEVKDLGRLRRCRSDRHVGGVAGGLARHLDVDPILVRVAFVVAVFLGGAGLLAYAAAWVLVPEDGSPDRPLGLDDRNRALALMGVGALAVLAALGDWVDAFWFPWPVAVVALGVLWFVNRKRSSYAPEPGRVPPAYDAGAWTAYDPAVPPPAMPVACARPGRPRNPRKRGPVLFWFTMMLIAIGEGVLAVVDAAGADVIPGAYPALALAVIAPMLLLGAFWGRAGGLILVGALATAGMAATASASHWEDQRIRATPLEAGEVSDRYVLDKGEIVLDLSRVGDVDALDGRDVHVEGGVGRVEVIVPEGVDVSVAAEVGVGDARVFSGRADGLGVTQDGFVDGGDEVPDMHITIDLGVGEVVVRES